MPVYLPVCLPVRLSICLSTCLYVYLLVCLHAWLSICLTVYLPACIPACLSTCRAVYLPACLSGCLPACLPVCLFLCFPLGLSMPFSAPLTPLSLQIAFPFASLSVFFCSPPPSLSDLSLLSSSLVLNRVFRFVSELVHDSQEATFLGLLRGVCCYSMHPSRFPVVLGYSAMFLTLAIDTAQSIAALSSSLPGLDIVTALADSHPD